MDSDELWRNCVQWFVAVGSLPRNHRANSGDAEIFDLAQTLRDGVVLCNTLNILAPGIVDDSRINFRAQMSEFLCMQNIRVVIYTLQTYFGMAAGQLFSAEDLYQMTNFAKVLRALSILSCKQEIAARFRPFREDMRSNSTQQHHNIDEEDIYGNLADLACERSLADEEDDLYDCVTEEKEEGIYGDLIAPKSASTKLDKRGCCIHEIVETESNYVSHLEMMIEQFIEPLRGILPEHSIQIIFINTETLHPIHKRFLDDLVKLQTTRISEAFTRHKDQFLVYGEYCSKLLDAQEHLKETMDKNEKARLKVEDCQDRSRRSKFKLRDLLTVPMQRLLKYHLLVKELLKHTADNHYDRADLEKALSGTKELARYINEVKRDSEELVKINQIELTLEDYDKSIPLRTYGKVRYDGELRVKFGDDRNHSTRNVFLLDKALFMTKLKSDSYILKDLIRLEDMQIDEMPPQKPNKAKWSHCWRLFSLKSGPSYVLHCKTESDKHKWTEAFRESFDNISPRALKGKSHNFAMQTFDKPTRCTSCNCLLDGTFYQGYECGVTHAISHKQCLSDTLKSIEGNKFPGLNTAAGSDRDPSAPPVPARDLHHVEANLPTTLDYKAHRGYNGNPPPPFPNSAVITFHIGEPIEVIQQRTPEWWKGRSLGDYDRIGYFPASYVSPLSKRQPRPSYMEAQIKNRFPPTQPGPRTEPAEELRLEEMTWYAGEIDRPRAEQILIDMPTGAFLVRKKSPQGLVVSLKFQKDVKHIKILQNEENMHYVAECKNFRSVQELIKFYEKNSLSGFFLGLETTLKFPYRDPVMFPASPIQVRSSNNGVVERSGTVTVDGRVYEVIGKAIAKYDFEARSEQELSLHAGQYVNIISKAGGAHGWWKGEYERRVGYFPTSFVEEKF